MPAFEHHCTVGPISYTLRFQRLLYEKDTGFARLRVSQNREYGRVLILDTQTQISEKDDLVYHECLVHPALLSHPKPENVLILGGGDGGSLREVLRHPSVKKAVMVEIDGAVISACKKHMPSLSNGAFDDARAEIHVGDGRVFLEKTTEKFDAIILDITEPAGPAKMLYTKEFFQLVKNHLNPGGALGFHAGVTMLDHEAECYARIMATAKSVFAQIRGVQKWMPVFVTDWAYQVAADNIPDAATLEKRAKDRGIALQHLVLETLLPPSPYNQGLIDRLGEVSTDQDPYDKFAEQSEK